MFLLLPALKFDYKEVRCVSQGVAFNPPSLDSVTVLGPCTLSDAKHLVRILGPIHALRIFDMTACLRGTWVGTDPCGTGAIFRTKWTAYGTDCSYVYGEV